MNRKIAATLGLALLGSVCMNSTEASALTINPNGTMTSGATTYTDTFASSVSLYANANQSTAFLFLELAGYKDVNRLGIYSYSGSGNAITLGNTLEVFSGPQSPISSVTLQFNLNAGTVTNLTTSQTASIGTTFGFYILNGANETLYSHAVLNADNFDHFKIYNTVGGPAELLGSSVVLAIEDKFGGGDKDFNDMVVGVTNVAATPEPSTFLLIGAGLIGLPFLRRKRS